MYIALKIVKYMFIYVIVYNTNVDSCHLIG